MLRSFLVWLGFAEPADDADHDHHAGHSHAGGHGHGHTHGVVDPTITTSDRGL